jgi:hypothetical protein
MRSIFARALGADFRRLHPKVQEWFGFSSADGIAARGTGMIERVWRGGWYTLPFLHVGAMRHIMFPEQGTDVPFTVENYACRDDRGTETLVIYRTFELARRRRGFDEYLMPTGTPGRIINRLGTHQHLAVDLDCSVGPYGAMRILSGAQRIEEGPIRFRFPRILSADADVSVGYDDDRACYVIDSMMRNRLLGTVFAYRGTFQVEWHDVSPEQVRERVRPKRTRS